jgi:dUTP pyrophosphatase
MKFEKLNKEECIEELKKISSDIAENLMLDFSLPRRSTPGSAGYDFHSPFSFCIMPKTTISIPLLVKVVDMPNNVVLELYNRSGLSLKKKITLDNAVGIIDSDYHNSIWLQVTNNDNKPYYFHQNDKVCQGIFHEVILTDDDAPEEIMRIGGFGSTGK